MADREKIYDALEALRKQRGATIDAIRGHPALMELSYVVRRAAERTGPTKPTQQAIAEECRTCLIEATKHLASPGAVDSRARLIRDNARAARVLLGLAPGTRGANMRTRRDAAKTVLSIGEDAISHKRDGYSYEGRLLRDVAEAMAELDAATPDSSPDFDVLEYHANLSLYPRNTFAQVRVDRTFVLRARRDGARHFIYHDEKGDDVAAYGEAKVPDGKVSWMDQGKALSPIHTFQLQMPVAAETRLDLYFGILYLDTNLALSLGPTNWDTLTRVSLSLDLPSQYATAVAGLVAPRGAVQSWEVSPYHNGLLFAEFDEARAINRYYIRVDK